MQQQHKETEFQAGYGFGMQVKQRRMFVVGMMVAPDEVSRCVNTRMPQLFEGINYPDAAVYFENGILEYLPNGTF